MPGPGRCCRAGCCLTGMKCGQTGHVSQHLRPVLHLAVACWHLLQSVAGTRSGEGRHGHSCSTIFLKQMQGQNVGAHVGSEEGTNREGIQVGLSSAAGGQEHCRVAQWLEGFESMLPGRQSRHRSAVKAAQSNTLSAEVTKKDLHAPKRLQVPAAHVAQEQMHAPCCMGKRFVGCPVQKWSGG